MGALPSITIDVAPTVAAASKMVCGASQETSSTRVAKSRTGGSAPNRSTSVAEGFGRKDTGGTPKRLNPVNRITAPEVNLMCRSPITLPLGGLIA